MNNNHLLNRASEYAQDGYFDRARQLILQAIQNDNKDAEAWWALAHVAISDTERHQAVREVLRLDPDNLHAQHMRDQIRAGSLASIDHPGKLIERKYDRLDDDFQGKAIMTLVAYFVFSIIGFGLNLYFLYEANKFQKNYGYRAKNVGCLWALLITFVITPLVIGAVVVGIAALATQPFGY